MKCDYTEVILTRNLEEQIYKLVLNYWNEGENREMGEMEMSNTCKDQLKKDLLSLIYHQIIYLFKERGIERKVARSSLESSEFFKNNYIPERVKAFLKELFELVREMEIYQLDRLDRLSTAVVGGQSKEVRSRSARLNRGGQRGLMGEMSTPEAIYQYFYHLKFLKQESMRAVYLRGYELLQTQEIFLGGRNGILMTAREIIAPALKIDADQMILVHNHPSGNTTPSERDFEFTSKIAEISNKLKINFLDHIIVGDYFFSFRKEGLL